ncbi:MAG: hypothetical protein HOP24_09310 [Sideroxydans sp.]|nr:hypothetical protein [Sideroxydans sp.]
MAVTRPKKAKAERSPIKLVLKDTRLKKFVLDVLLPVEEAGKGRTELSYGIGLPPEIDINDCSAILSIKGKGVSKIDSSKVAFTFDTELAGLFSLSRNPSDEEIELLSIDMADLIAPVLSDTIETAMFKTGYPRLRIPKSFPPSNIDGNK